MVVREDTATAQMMQTKGHFGTREVMLREAVEAKAGVQRSWGNDIKSGMFLQLERTRYFKRLETRGCSPRHVRGQVYSTFREYFAILRRSLSPTRYRPSLEVVIEDAYFAECSKASPRSEVIASLIRPGDSPSSKRPSGDTEGPLPLDSHEI